MKRSAAVALGTLTLLAAACAPAEEPATPPPTTPPVTQTTSPQTTSPETTASEEPTMPQSDDIPVWDPQPPESPATQEAVTESAALVFAAYRALFPDLDWGQTEALLPQPLEGSDYCAQAHEQAAGGTELVHLDVEELNKTAAQVGLLPAERILYDAGGNQYFIADTATGDRFSLEAKTLVRLRYDAVVTCE